jgi:hypothetical protein
MKKLLLLSVFAAGGGCNVWIDPAGRTSMCGDKFLMPHIKKAINYWNNAGLQALEPCSNGSIYVGVADLKTTLHAEGYTTFGLTMTITLDYDAYNHDDSYTDFTLAHEFGHALSLEHTRDPSSVMHPVFRELNYYTSPYDIQQGYRLLNNELEGKENAQLNIED